MTRNGRKYGKQILLALLVSVVLVFAWALPRSGWYAGPQSRVLVIYSFSTLDGLLEEGILPAFREHWQKEQGERVEFAATFAGSGNITGMMVSRFPAEIAIVSSELDAHRLPVPFKSWRELPHNGVPARTRLVLVVREGNPLEIETFSDLARPGLELVHGDPENSGAANLAILAEYGSQFLQSGDSEKAEEQLLGIWRNVTSEAPSSRAARVLFESGVGDVLITYEHDVVGTPSKPPIQGKVLTPAGTILVEPVVAKVPKNIDPHQIPLVDAFLDFLWSLEAQEIFSKYGFESVLEDPASSWDSEQIFTLEDLGGASAARRDILDAIWKERVMSALDRQH